MKLLLRHIILAIALLAGAVSATSQINTDQVMRVGQNALYFEDYLLSIQYFNKVIEAKPYLAKPYFYRAIAKLNLEDYRGAIADASKSIELNPFITDAYEVRGVALQNLGRTKEAIVDYDKALSQLPDNRNIMFNKALAQEDIHELDSARITLDNIIASHPGYENAYVGRAKVLLELKDTVAAEADIDKALSINKNIANAYLMRADIALATRGDYEAALTDLDETIRLQPKMAGLFINRAFLRYHVNDYFGAMADYDYAIALDSDNEVAYFNRGLLRMEVGDNDNAIKDFSKVLEYNPEEFRARYNRAMLYKDAGDYRKAIADIDKVIAAAPDFSIPVYVRFQLYDALGDKKSAARDYDKAIAIARTESAEYRNSLSQGTEMKNGFQKLIDKKKDTPVVPGDNDELVAQEFARKFTSLLTTENEISEEQEFNNKNIRGKVQDRNVAIEIEPEFTASYYVSSTDLAPSSHFMMEVDKINTSHQLRNLLQITNTEPNIDDESKIKSHFESIEYFNSYLATHQPRAIDYFGRGMDQFTLRNYEAAAADFTLAIGAAPDFTLAYFMRGVAATRRLHSNEGAHTSTDPAIDRESRRARYQAILDDYDKVLEYSPRSPFAYFNKGNIYIDMQDLTSALSALNKAIELKPDFGEAYYNRGYVYFKLGNKEAGSADLSRAGQLGIMPSYNLLKRIDN